MYPTFHNSVRDRNVILRILPPSKLAGFLIAIPLLEEWKGEDGIQALEGWTFQVCLVYVYASTSLAYLIVFGVVLFRVRAYPSRHD